MLPLFQPRKFASPILKTGEAETFKIVIFVPNYTPLRH